MDGGIKQFQTWRSLVLNRFIPSSVAGIDLAYQGVVDSCNCNRYIDEDDTNPHINEALENKHFLLTD